MCCFLRQHKRIFILSENQNFFVQIYPSDPNSNAFPPSPSTPSGSPQAVSGEWKTYNLKKELHMLGVKWTENMSS